MVHRAWVKNQTLASPAVRILLSPLFLFAAHPPHPRLLTPGLCIRPALKSSLTVEFYRNIRRRRLRCHAFVALRLWRRNIQMVANRNHPMHTINFRAFAACNKRG